MSEGQFLVAIVGTGVGLGVALGALLHWTRGGGEARKRALRRGGYLNGGRR
ncbi:MAG: hypothetical protein ACRD2Z_00115 [Thermoanaerobaculia bacterium]